MSADITAAAICIPDGIAEELTDPLNADTTKLAYIGDAVYEVFVRMEACGTAGRHAGDMNRFSVRYVRADSQAEAAKALMDDFATEEELRLMKRARNRTNTAHPRGSTEKAYKLATGFEALIGWLYVKGETERLSETVKKAMTVIDGLDDNGR